MFRYLLKCGADELIQDKVELVFIYPKGIKSLPQTLFFYNPYILLNLDCLTTFSCKDIEILKTELVQAKT